ncbi:hypothetical protein [Pseudomonas sp.]|uniref:hypothetical protein n=1 Tax=Pseudomonas sp. TaxID=306 RepID=UPI003FD7A02C
MADEIFIAINSAELHAKSKVYVGRALTRKADGNLDEYQLWASLALELLGKAALSRKHPSLIVDPNHAPSMFVAAGINVTTDVKTITAKTVFERLTHLVPRFDKEMQKFCLAISERRNAELHSADIPFRSMKLDAWERQYWYASESILQSMGLSLEDWLGAAGAQAPRHLLDEAEQAIKAAVELRIDAARARFMGLKKSERDRLSAEAATRYPIHQHDCFTAVYDYIWEQECPACMCNAFMAGTQESEDISEDSDEDYIWETVERTFTGEEFICRSCELALVGSAEIEASGLPDTHEDKEERELEYEPDYGND